MASGLIELYFSYQENKNAQADIQRERAASAVMQSEQFIDEIERHVRQAAKTRGAALMCEFGNPLAPQAVITAFFRRSE